MTTLDNPEIGANVDVGGIRTNYIEAGDRASFPLILIHGSGPGVTAFANWHGVIPRLSENYHVLAPDMLGFGYTDCPADISDFTLDLWVNHIIGFMDALGIEQASFIGNSYGGALTLALAARAPERVKRMVLMGSAGAFTVTKGLAEVWGYQPSAEAMRALMKTFAYDSSLVTDKVVESRYQASIRPGAQESFSRLFPEPRQERLDALVTPDDQLAKLTQRTLVVHGREDEVVPLAVSLHYAKVIPHSELHVFGECGHWTQIEKRDRFLEVVIPFLAD